MINRSTVVGVFDDRNQAERAVEELRRLGFRDDQIGFAARGEQAEGTRNVGEGAKQTGEGAATGAVSGGVIGGIIGAAISGLIPGIGPVIAGGILASVLGGAAVGAAAGGLFGALVGEGVPEEEARYYDQEFRGGRTIVTVRADGRYDEAQNALRRFGAYDVHSRDREAMGTATSPSAGSESTTIPGDHVRTSSDMGAGMGTIPSGTSSRGASASTSDWASVSPRYRQSWQQRYGTSGRRWEDVEPYYRYGYEMSSDPRYQGRSWSEVERDLQTGYRPWASRSGYRGKENLWTSVKDDLRDAWDNLRGRGTDTSNLTARGTRESTDLGNRDRMELREERLDVGKRNVKAGEVRLGKDVVEEQQSIDVPVSHEEAYIERRPVSGDRPVTGEIGTGEIRIPLHGEVVDVGKETVVREEVELGKRTVQDTQHVSDTVRREEARLDTTGDVEVRDKPTSGGVTQQHEHIYDERGNCLTCGKTRREIERGRRAA